MGGKFGVKAAVDCKPRLFCAGTAAESMNVTFYDPRKRSNRLEALFCLADWL
jgi:hypothetical protein